MYTRLDVEAIILWTIANRRARNAYYLDIEAEEKRALGLCIYPGCKRNSKLASNKWCYIHIQRRNREM